MRGLKSLIKEDLVSKNPYLDGTISGWTWEDEVWWIRLLRWIYLHVEVPMCNWIEGIVDRVCNRSRDYDVDGYVRVDED